MALQVTRVEGGYRAEVSPPHGDSWKTATPMTRDELVHRLYAVNCHGVDIYDALHLADDAWEADQAGDPSAEK